MSANRRARRHAARNSPSPANPGVHPPPGTERRLLAIQQLAILLPLLSIEERRRLWQPQIAMLCGPDGNFTPVGADLVRKHAGHLPIMPPLASSGAWITVISLDDRNKGGGQ